MGGLAEHGECQGRPVDPKSGSCYLGNTNSLTEDMEHRLRIIQQVLDIVHADAFSETPAIDHNDAVLKILMLPEFFARGPNGAYSTRQLLEDGLLVAASDAIRDLVARDEFSDYLFVFGTVITARSPNDPRLPWEHALNHDEVFYYNFAPVYRGGPDRQHRFLVTKKYISTADFLSRVTLPNPAVRNDYRHRQYDDLPNEFLDLLVKREVQLIEDNIIELEGLRIGLEICLDHRMGALWQNLQKKHRGRVNNDDLVDIQLVTSAGMSIERGPNPIKTGGVVYLTDGEASSAACRRTDTTIFEPEHVCRDNLKAVKHIPQGGPGYSNYFTPAACMDVFDRELYHGYYSSYQPQGCANTQSLRPRAEASPIPVSN